MSETDTDQGEPFTAVKPGWPAESQRRGAECHAQTEGIRVGTSQELGPSL